MHAIEYHGGEEADDVLLSVDFRSTGELLLRLTLAKMSNSKHILIVGGGTFGLSTAYHLAKSGYKNITVVDQSEFLPAEVSAGNDYNKIIRAEYEDPWYADLALVCFKELSICKDQGIQAD